MEPRFQEEWVIERIVAEQLVKYLQVNDLMPKLQSAYRRRHSTETALLRVLSDIYAPLIVVKSRCSVC